jgi:hypothetical protein
MDEMVNFSVKTSSLCRKWVDFHLGLLCFFFLDKFIRSSLFVMWEVANMSA